MAKFFTLDLRGGKKKHLSRWLSAGLSIAKSNSALAAEGVFPPAARLRDRREMAAANESGTGRGAPMILIPRV